jgi:hypothetical protein
MSKLARIEGEPEICWYPGDDQQKQEGQGKLDGSLA